MERPGPPSPASPAPAADHGERRVPKHRRPLARITARPAPPRPGAAPTTRTGRHRGTAAPRDSGGIASLTACWGHRTPPPSHHFQEGRGAPQPPPFPSCWAAAPSDPQGPLLQDTAYPTQTPPLRGAIPTLCLIGPLRIGGQTLPPTLGVWHLQTFNFRVIFLAVTRADNLNSPLPPHFGLPCPPCYGEGTPGEGALLPLDFSGASGGGSARTNSFSSFHS